MLKKRNAQSIILPIGTMLTLFGYNKRWATRFGQPIHATSSMLLLEVETVVVHNLNPRLHEVANKLLAVIILCVELTV